MMNMLQDKSSGIIGVVQKVLRTNISERVRKKSSPHDNVYSEYFPSLARNTEVSCWY